MARHRRGKLEELNRLQPPPDQLDVDGSASCEADYSCGSWPIPPNTFVTVTVEYSGDDHHAASEDTATLGFNVQ